MCNNAPVASLPHIQPQTIQSADLTEHVPYFHSLHVQEQCCHKQADLRLRLLHGQVRSLTCY